MMTKRVACLDQRELLSLATGIARGDESELRAHCLECRVCRKELRILEGTAGWANEEVLQSVEKLEDDKDLIETLVDLLPDKQTNPHTLAIGGILLVIVVLLIFFPT